MKLTGITSLNRFEWAAIKAKELLRSRPNAMHYDVGAGEDTLRDEIGVPSDQSRSFDLAPKKTNIESWNIEQPFPYDHPRADLVTFLEIVEHLNNPWLCLKNLGDILAPQGWLILTTPNPGWSTSRLGLLFKGYLTCFTRSDLELNHHVFVAWPHILQRLLADNGFEVIEYVALDGKTRLFDHKLRPLSAFVQLPARLIKKLIEYRDPTAVGMSYGVIARKIG